jgi:hypothetical protein
VGALGRLTGAGVALLAAGASLAQGYVGQDPEPGITVHELVRFLHLLLFVFWLGADLGVFLAARAVVAPDRSVADRLNAAWLMSAIDVAPRIALCLMLTVGGILTEFVGIGHPPWQIAGILLLGPAWLALVLASYLRRGTSIGRAVDRADFAFRCVLIPAIVASVASSWFTGRLDAAPYVAAKLLIFALLLLLGLLVRRRLAPFRAGLDALAGAGDPVPVEAAMTRSLASARPLIICIWLGLALAAYLGVTRQGTPVAPPSAATTAGP